MMATMATTEEQTGPVRGSESVAEQVARGKAARAALPRRRHGEWAPASGRVDALSILEQQERSRVEELVPIRHGRMAASAFAYYRGAAAVMASDLGTEPRTGLDVQLCGDAHLVNFGGFAAPDRTLVFDVNDFDETLPGPFEWDVKRLAASLEVAGRDRDFRRTLRQRTVAAGARAYREAIREFASVPLLDVWYARLDVAGIEQRWGAAVGGDVVRNLERMAAKAERKNQLKAFDRLTEVRDGTVRFASDPPCSSRSPSSLPTSTPTGSRTRSPSRCSATGAPFPTTGGSSYPATGSSTSLERSSGSAASVPAAGSPCCSGVTSTTRCSSR